MKIIGKKMKMSQLWKNDKVWPITPVKVENGDLASFKEGDRVKVSSVSKGKGFQGVVKRHGFAGGPATHGQKNRHRAPGSIGNTSPQRVIPGRRMAGHMGARRVSVKNLKIVTLDQENKIINLYGAVPGNNGGRVEIYKS